MLRDNLELAVRQGPLNPIRICNIVNKMIELAEKGDVKAAKLVWLMATQSSGSDETANQPAGIKIIVENATFKAAEVLPTASIRVTNAVDAEFSEVK